MFTLVTEGGNQNIYKVEIEQSATNINIWINGTFVGHFDDKDNQLCLSQRKFDDLNIDIVIENK